MGRIILKEGNHGRQDTVDSFSTDNDFEVQPRENDEARSMILEDVPAHSLIELYDSPSGEFGNHFTVYVKESQPRIVINTFHNTDTNHPHVIMNYSGKRNGLDGKVSFIRFTRDGSSRLFQQLQKTSRIKSLTQSLGRIFRH